MTYPHPRDETAGEVEGSTAATEADAWRRPGAWYVPPPPWTPLEGPAALRGADKSSRPAPGSAGPPGHSAHYRTYPPHLPNHPYSPATSVGGSESLARPAAVVTAVLAGLVLLVVAFGLGGMILLRAATTQAPRVPDLRPFPSPAAPRTEPPGGGAPGQTGTTGKYAAVYEVTGVGAAHVSYTITEGNSVAMLQQVTLPWRITVHLDTDVGEVTLRAITEGDPPEDFGCTLVVGGERVTDTTPDEVGAVMCQIRPQPGDGLVPSTDPDNVTVRH